MKNYALVAELQKLCDEAGIKLEKMWGDNGHYQIHGKLLVNYYPLSKKRSAYVARTTKGKNDVTPAQAVAMAMEQPEIAPQHLKADRARNSRAIRHKMMKGRETVPCHWCKTPIMLDTSTIEHIVPIDRGGLDNANNRVLACAPCNAARGNNMPELEKP